MTVEFPPFKVPLKAAPLEVVAEVAQQMWLAITLNMAAEVGVVTRLMRLLPMMAVPLYSEQAAVAEAVLP
jgi:hypothetical protein